MKPPEPEKPNTDEKPLGLDEVSFNNFTDELKVI